MKHLSITSRQICPFYLLLVSFCISLPASAQISGPGTVCVYEGALYTDVVTGGIWSCSNTSIATIGSTTGFVTALSAGVDTISYNVSGVITTRTITVNPGPGAIIGPTGLCFGTTLSLTNPVAGGVWSSGDISVVAIGSGSGIATGISAGAAMITYTLPTGCLSTVTLTVQPMPGQLMGCNDIGTGDSISFYGINSTHYLSSSNPGVASISPVTKKIKGVSPGTATISLYNPYTGCIAATRNISVTPVTMIKPITGTNILCEGGTALQNDILIGGVWSTGNPAIAIISSSGLVTAISGGMATISYSVSGFTCTEPFAVNSIPVPISGPAAVCLGDTITLNSNPGYARWGTYIDYTGWYSFGPFGMDGYIPPPMYGGWFTSNDSTKAKVISETDPGTGHIKGISSGIAVITYTDDYNYCYVTSALTVNTLPIAGYISGLSAVCIGSLDTLTDPSLGGTWTTANANADISAGVVTGISSGIDTIFYSVTNSCGTSATSKTITINPLPVVGPVTGLSAVCVSSTITLSDSITGGTWSSSNSNATVSGGITTGVSSGIDTIIYTSVTTCGSLSAARIITVNPLPYAGSIVGSTDVCIGSSIIMTDTTTGGSWSSTTGNATVVSGTVAGVTSGPDTIAYSVTNGCGTAAATELITVNPLPLTFSLTGGGSFCAGGAGVDISLSSSQSLLSYVLYNDTSSTGITLTGTGGTIDFGLFTVPGIYTITAFSTLTGCENNMTGADTISVVPLVVPAVGIISSSGPYFIPGIYDTLTAVTTGGGTSPSYQWYLNSVAISGATDSTYITNTYSVGDTISCTVTSSAECGSSGSGYIRLFITALVNNVDPSCEMLIYPNPNKGTFLFNFSDGTNDETQIVINDITGRKIKEYTTSAGKPVSIKLDTPPGLYFISSKTSRNTYIRKVTVE